MKKLLLLAAVISMPACCCVKNKKKKLDKVKINAVSQADAHKSIEYLVKKGYQVTVTVDPKN